MIIYSDDTQNEIDILQTMVSGFDTTTIGAKEMTITYRDKTCKIDYNVINSFKVGKYKLKMGTYYISKMEIYTEDGTLQSVQTGNDVSSRNRLKLNADYTTYVLSLAGEMQGEASWFIDSDNLIKILYKGSTQIYNLIDDNTLYFDSRVNGVISGGGTDKDGNPLPWTYTNHLLKLC